jgi:hypothetical protein
MSYQNRNYNNNNYSRNTGGNYGNSGGYSGNSGSYSRSYGGNAPVKKKSGSKAGTAFSRSTGEGKPWVSGWKKVNGGIISIICGPYHKTDTYESKMGRKSQTWLANIQPPNGAQAYRLPCMYYMDTGRVVIDGLGFVINPKAANGGYCGTFKKKGR